MKKEFCEWKFVYTIDKKKFFSPCDKTKEHIDKNEFKFCPYCGKKIIESGI